MIPKIKVLIVDDEEAFVSPLANRLSVRDMEVLTAYSGPEGLKKLEENPDLDVVLLDVRMPVMDGIEALKRIKAEHPIVEVIMLTGFGTVETAVEGMKLGAFHFFLKPAEIEELVAKIQDASEQRRSHLMKILEAKGKELRGRRGK
jgi:DNA-binding NtrC family response regulator